MDRSPRQNIKANSAVFIVSEVRSVFGKYHISQHPELFSIFLRLTLQGDSSFLCDCRRYEVRSDSLLCRDSHGARLNPCLSSHSDSNLRIPGGISLNCIGLVALVPRNGAVISEIATLPDQSSQAQVEGSIESKMPQYYPQLAASLFIRTTNNDRGLWNSEMRHGQYSRKHSSEFETS